MRLTWRLAGFITTSAVGVCLIAAGCGVVGSPGVSGGGGASTSAPSPIEAHVGVSGHLTSGPTCPVEQMPPDPRCAPQAVVGATVIVTDAAGRQVARALSDAHGYYVVDLAPGTYSLAPQPVTGLMRTPSPVTAVVGEGTLGGVTVDFSYDTGIR